MIVPLRLPKQVSQEFVFHGRTASAKHFGWLTVSATAGKATVSITDGANDQPSPTTIAAVDSSTPSGTVFCAAVRGNASGVTRVVVKSGDGGFQGTVQFAILGFVPDFDFVS